MQVSVREQIEIFIAWSRLITITDREATVSFCNSRLLAQRALVGTRSRASRRRLSDNDIRWSASDRQWFPARPAQHVHRRRNNGTGRIQSALASAWQKRHKGRRDMQSRTRRSTSTIGGAAPDTIIGPWCRGSRGSASLPRHRCENASIAVPREPPQDFFTCPSVHEKLSAVQVQDIGNTIGSIHR
jgi:hypothetical protein